MAYTAEEEQEIEDIKSWWHENYKVIIAALVLGFGGAWGWHYWQGYQVTQTHKASSEYEQIVMIQDATQRDSRLAEFVKNNDKTTYAVFALLDQAKDAVATKDFATAENALKQATAQAQDDVLLSVSALRLASVQYQQKQYDAALDSLKLVKNSSWDNQKSILTGDIQFTKGDNAAAKASYEQALVKATPVEQQWLQLRLNNL
ncbi:chaperone protein HscA [Cricetibacter osteomyelitidis]|uniref:Ancillary SecYEG translocon subunit n=1 Tax=Cricetibacter osteomyelitidis TaxID=1521931 RepID=A0A4R2SWY8_9PAST|nr:YfgM family protein [Cricetibacter osteomyelitidis]TCP93411.1 chaperone protein HscA [Cricetibacter osteomyelitidis]